MEKRLFAHNAKKGAKYTKARLPVKLMYTEVCENKEAALRREHAIKKLKRKEKWALIDGMH